MKNRTTIIMAGMILLVAGAWAEPGDERFSGGSYDGWDRNVMTAAKGLGGALVSLSSGSDQLFDWTQAAPALAMLTIEADDPQGTITNGGTIRVTVPAAWACRFDTGAVPTLGGDAVGKVGAASFADEGRTLAIPVTEDFAADDTLTVSGLKLADLRLVTADTQRLELDFTGNGVRDVYDSYTVQVRVQWNGGSYDGWDRNATVEYASLAGSGGTVVLIR